MSRKIIYRTASRFLALWILLLLLMPALFAACARPKSALPVPSFIPKSSPLPQLTPSSNPASNSSSRIYAEWILPEVDESTASVPLSTVTSKRMTHFGLKLEQGDITFMVYELDGEIFARASVCVPCRGRNFSIQKDLVICDTCGTIFKAKTGEGVSGVQACMSYPKALVPYQIKGDSIIMKSGDLMTAYQNTLQRGLP